MGTVTNEIIYLRCLDSKLQTSLETKTNLEPEFNVQSQLFFQRAAPIQKNIEPKGFTTSIKTFRSEHFDYFISTTLFEESLSLSCTSLNFQTTFQGYCLGDNRMREKVIVIGDQQSYLTKCSKKCNVLIFCFQKARKSYMACLDSSNQENCRSLWDHPEPERAPF